MIYISVPIVLGFVVLGFVYLFLKKYFIYNLEPKLIGFIGRTFKIDTSHVDLAIDKQVYAEVRYNEYSRELVTIIDKEKNVVITPQYDSEPEKLIRYLVNNPNRDVSKEELINKAGLSPTSDLSSLVSKLKFNGLTRKMFFSVSKNTIKLSTPITNKDFKQITN